MAFGINTAGSKLISFSSSAVDPVNIKQCQYKSSAMHQPTEVDLSSNTKPSKKASFMIEDLLRSTHVSSSHTTDRSERHYETTHCNSLADESRDDPSTTAALSPDQEHHLEKVFRLKQYLGTKERQRLADTIQATDQQVKEWFQNKRIAVKLQIDKAQHRYAKLAYLNSLAQSLLNTTVQPSLPSTFVSPSVRKCTSHFFPHVPYGTYSGQKPSRYSRPQRVTPYSLNQNRYRFARVTYVDHFRPQVVPGIAKMYC